jgi:UDP-glucose 4-epimerase
MRTGGQHLPASHPRWCRTSCGGAAARTLVVHGQDPSRDYVYVDDVMSAMVAAPRQWTDSDQRGSGTETSVRDLVREVLEVTTGKPEVIYNSKTSGGVSRMAADLRCARE